MKRRFRGGIELPERDFHAQEWTRGMLQLERGVLYLCLSSPGNMPPPYGILYRPVIKACFSDTISFSGLERDGAQWVAQVWYCMVGSGNYG